MKNNKITAIAVFIIFLISGCSQATQDLYYTEIRDGTQLKYTVYYHEPSIGVQKAQAAYHINGTKIINGKTYHREAFIVDGIPGILPMHYYVRSDQQGKYSIDSDDDTETEFLEIPNSLQLGSSWSSNNPTHPYYSRVEAIEPLQLFDQKFEQSLKISVKSSEFEGYTYHVANIGIVKLVGTYSDGAILEATLNKH